MTIQEVDDDVRIGVGGRATEVAMPDVCGTITDAPQNPHVPGLPANSGPTVFFSRHSGQVNSIAMP